MRGRFYFADGRVTEDVNVDERVARHPVFDDRRLRWFRKTGEIDADGYAVFREFDQERMRRGE